MSPDRDKPIVLIADDAPDNIMLINEILKNQYRIKVATNGKRALEVAAGVFPDIILMDVMMPVLNGYEACRRLKEDERLKDIPVLFLTARSDEKDEETGFTLGGADYIRKPIYPSVLVARIKLHLELKNARDILKNQNRLLDEEVRLRAQDIALMQEASIMAMAALAEARNNETGLHLQQVKGYIKILAEFMGKMPRFKKHLTKERIGLIVLSSPLHDIGKVGIPDHILLKPGPLSREEFEIMKNHTTLGRDAILCAEKLIGGAENFLTCAREIAYSHHEKWDGSGYPQGISGANIPFAARLMAVVDAYDALTSPRVYKPAVSHQEAVKIMQAGAGKHFDPDIIRAFLEVEEQFRLISERTDEDSQVR